MMREVFFLIDTAGAVILIDEGRSAVAIADSRTRWEAIWDARDRIGEIAHSHPVGPLAFSEEDETTFAALEAGLGKALVFSVIAPNGMIRRENGRDSIVASEPAWATELRRVSGMLETKTD
jgi:hypothetical protein